MNAGGITSNSILTVTGGATSIVGNSNVRPSRLTPHLKTRVLKCSVLNILYASRCPYYVSPLQYAGSLSVIGTATSGSVLDVYSNYQLAYSGNVIQARVSAGPTVGNPVYLTEGANVLMEVTWLAAL